MKRLFVFILTFMMVLGYKSNYIVKAADSNYSMEQVLSYYGFTWDAACDDFVDGTISNNNPYYFIFRVVDTGSSITDVAYYAARCSAVPVSCDYVTGTTHINLFDADGNKITFSMMKSSGYYVTDNLSSVKFTTLESNDVILTGSDYDCIYYSNFDDSFLGGSLFVISDDIYIDDDAVYWIQGNTDGIVDVTSTILQLLKTFPLNVITVGWITVICVGTFRLLKLSNK